MYGDPASYFQSDPPFLRVVAWGHPQIPPRLQTGSRDLAKLATFIRSHLPGGQFLKRHVYEAVSMVFFEIFKHPAKKYTYISM